VDDERVEEGEHGVGVSVVGARRGSARARFLELPREVVRERRDARAARGQRFGRLFSRDAEFIQPRVEQREHRPALDARRRLAARAEAQLFAARLHRLERV
jgi:hypothetical protein